MIYQAIKPDTVLNKLKKLAVPRTTFAAVLGRSGTLVSLYLSGRKGLSYEMQAEVSRVLEFFDDLVKECAVPVDFRQTEKIMSLWRAYKAKLAKSEVMRSSRALEQRAE